MFKIKSVKYLVENDLDIINNFNKIVIKYNYLIINDENIIDRKLYKHNTQIMC